MNNLKLQKKAITVGIILCTLIVITFIISAGLGYSDLTYQRLLPTIMGNGTFKEEFVLFSIRLPRMIIVLLAGMALAASGSILQSITRNDLADPGIVGINAGAGVAVAVFFLFFPIQTGWFVYMLPAVAFLGALATAGLIYLFSYSRENGLEPLRFILVGVGVSMGLSGIMIVLISTAERTKVDFIAKWLAGNIWGADWPFIYALLPWLLILLPFTLFKTQSLNILTLSQPIAVGVGLRVQRERLLLLLTAVALAAAAVSVTGGISFIGLMAPHIARSLVGPRHQFFLPAAILTGGWLLLFADTIGRNILEPDGVPTGIMVALIGAPYFLYLLLRKTG